MRFSIIISVKSFYVRVLATQHLIGIWSSRCCCFSFCSFVPPKWIIGMSIFISLLSIVTRPTPSEPNVYVRACVVYVNWFRLKKKKIFYTFHYYILIWLIATESITLLYREYIEQKRTKPSIESIHIHSTHSSNRERKEERKTERKIHSFANNCSNITTITTGKMVYNLFMQTWC